MFEAQTINHRDATARIANQSGPLQFGSPLGYAFALHVQHVGDQLPRHHQFVTGQSVEAQQPEHQVSGEFTAQCIEGSIEFTAAGTSQQMRAGDLICLVGGVAHAQKAVEDSSVLVTILLHGA